MTLLLLGICLVDDVDLCQALLDRGADLKARDETGQTAVMLAACEGRPAILAWLLEKLGKDDDMWSLTDSNGWNAVIWAARRNHVCVLEFLLETFGKDHSMWACVSTEGEGYTVTSAAVWMSHIDVLDFLLATFGKDHSMWDHTGSFGDSLVTLAATKGRVRVLNWILASLGKERGFWSVAGGIKAVTAAVSNGHDYVLACLERVFDRDDGEAWLHQGRVHDVPTKWSDDPEDWGSDALRRVQLR